MHFKDSYIFGKDDAERLIDIIKNFFGKGRYPAFTIYDESKGHYVTKLHPVLKILIVIESIAIVIVAITGVVLYNLEWSPFGIPIASWILSVAWYFASFFNINALGLLRLLHLLAAYWFVFELVIHVGIIEFDHTYGNIIKQSSGPEKKTFQILIIPRLSQLKQSIYLQRKGLENLLKKIIKFKVV